MTTRDESGAVPENEGPEDFREHMKELKEDLTTEQERNQSLFEENVSFKLDALGLDPNKGVGRSIVKDIARGEFEGDLTAETLAAYAESEYGETVHIAGSPAPVPPGDQEQELDKAQQKLNELAAGSSDTPPSTQQVDVIAEYERELHENDEVDSAIIKGGMRAKVSKLQSDWREGRIHTTPEP